MLLPNQGRRAEASHACRGCHDLGGGAGRQEASEGLGSRRHLAGGRPEGYLPAMCGRYASYLPPDAIVDLFRAAGRPNLPPN